MERRSIGRERSTLDERSALATERFWRSLDERDDPTQGESAQGESAQGESAQSEDARMDEETSRWIRRRRFLQLMGGSIALSACTRQPPEVIVPYVTAPEDQIPGHPLFFATASLLSGVAAGVLVESHEGRPTKVEGNPEHPSSLGATDAFAQAAILDLYDPDRSQALTHLGQITTWEAFVGALQVEMGIARGKRGKGLHLLTGAVTSPSLRAAIEALLAPLPLAAWHWYEPVSRAGVREGARIAFGVDVEPRPHFDRARVIVSLDGDFLSQTEGSIRAARDFSEGRRAGAEGRPMSRLYAVTTTPGLTSAAADHRLLVRPSRVEAVALALAALAGVEGAPEVPLLPEEQAFLAAAARDLRAARGEGLIVAGDLQTGRVHALAHRMNAALGNAGRTVGYIPPIASGAPDPMASLAELCDALDAGEVELLVIAGPNPVYSAPADLDFGRRIARARLRVHLGPHEDETAELCHWHVPEAHPLEAWGDARSADGTITLIQPLIEPLYGGKSAIELLSALGERPTQRGYDLVRAHHRERAGLSPDGFEAMWRAALHLGFIEGSAAPETVPALLALGPPAPAETARGEGFELVFRPDPSAYDGRFANNAWLMELPRPLTKMVWDNAAWIAPATARELGVESGDVVEIAWEGRRLRAPAWIMPGQAPATITLHLGYGRRRGGRVCRGVGFDAGALRAARSPWAAAGASITRTGERYPLVTTQTHATMDGRDIVRAAGVAAYQRALASTDPAERGALAAAAFGVHEPGERPSLYPKHLYPGHAWGMSIDLSACIGCMACVIACQSENTVPVVGKEEVARGREMHWLRVDRYYEGPPDDPQTRFMPVPCMHCENAPCEVVCPVEATVHDGEGLNTMVYNRCVGTRYCSNNCPYKVRRYNFFAYAREAISPLDAAAPVLALMRNPDVTVRSYGVMEKCTYCVQRIRHARIEATIAGRAVRDGEVMTACEAVCPTRAITFGDQNDPSSRVARRKAELRTYALLAELNTVPRTTYLGDLDNPSPELGRP